MSSNQQIAAVVLAAGKGTRLNATEKNKVVHALGEKPMISYSIDNLQHAGIETIIVVIGFAKDSVKQVLGDQVKYAIQDEPLGTAHALQAGLSQIPPATDTVISLYGDDSAFYTKEVFDAILSHHKKTQAAVTVLTLELKDPTGLGRIIRNSAGNVAAIVEEKSATPEQKAITEINTGLYVFDKQFLNNYINKVQKNPESQEYYLTDLIKIAVDNQHTVTALLWPDPSCWHGVNTREQLQEAKKRMQARQDE